VPKIQLKEVVKDFDDNFDYKNLIQFRDPEFLKKKYGEDFYNKFLYYFETTWFQILGNAIYDELPVPHLIADDLRSILKHFDADFEDDDLSDYDESYVHQFPEVVNNTWSDSRDSYFLQEVK
tara:strand:+ start:172 stop:537 length:366 start_codon:yes stop_codon:yes gene_type:complete